MNHISQATAEQRRATTHAFVRLAIVIVLAVTSATAAVAYPIHGWTLGWFAGLAYGWVVHSRLAGFNARRHAGGGE